MKALDSIAKGKNGIPGQDKENRNPALKPCLTSMSLEPLFIDRIGFFYIKCFPNYFDERDRKCLPLYIKPKRMLDMAVRE